MNTQLVILSPIGQSLTWSIHRKNCPGMGRHARRAVAFTEPVEYHVKDLTERKFKVNVCNCTKVHQ